MSHWVSTDTYLIVRSESSITISGEFEGTSMEGYIRQTGWYYDYGKDVSIELPKEAESAEDITVSLRQEAYDVDEEVIQLASATFYSDRHAGWRDVNDDDKPDYASTFNDNVWSDSGADTFAGHYYPTAIAVVRNHILKLSTIETDPDTGNPRMEGASGAATTAEITAHAIWMGLLVNAQGEGTQNNGSQDRDWVSPLQGDTSLYLNLIPESAMAGDTYNGAPEPGGEYCWVVGNNGRVYGVYPAADGNWYAGFNGSYP